ncbi:hypothetical protein HPB47_009621 [Ixodes persulcatus]|uniref:Uncharacterized protein n=1 Tax=Ixodes persulcatus TaxID=34615 RepID=A0AC60P1C2_IXOPE|nr:hypothetical protein HPB47_009621 [Ixodes persulcatus]
MSRPVTYSLIEEFEASPMYPAADHGGSPAKSAEQHSLSFLWYAANKACIRDVAGRFDLGESTLHQMMERVLDFLLIIGPRIVKFPDDLERLSRDFEAVCTHIRCELSEKQRARDETQVYEVWVRTAKPRLAFFLGIGSPEQRGHVHVD